MYKKLNGRWLNGEGKDLKDLLNEHSISMEEVENSLKKLDSFLIKSQFTTVLKFELMDELLKVTPFYSDKDEDLKFIWTEGMLTPLTDTAMKYVNTSTGFIDLDRMQEDGLDYYIELRGKVTIVGLMKRVETGEFSTLLDFEQDVVVYEEEFHQDPLNKPNYITVIKAYDDLSKERLKRNLKEAQSAFRDMRVYKTGINEFTILSHFNMSNVVTDQMVVEFKSEPIIELCSTTLSETRKKLFRDLENSTDKEEENLVRGYFKVLHNKTDETADHSERLSRIVTIVGQDLLLPDDNIRLLWKMAKVHDIGKLSIEGKIINKPGKLNSEEFGIIKKHTVLGYEMLAGIASYEDARIACLQHHERYDGKGYPYGLKGSEINPLAKIITVADCIDAMVSTRVYKGAYDFDYVRKELEENQGKQFDPKIVKATLNRFNDIQRLY